MPSPTTRDPGLKRRLRHPLRTVAEWGTKYPFAPRYRRRDRRWITTVDGVRLRVAIVPGPPRPEFAIVLAHGFSNSSRAPRIHQFAHLLARRAVVIVPDLRGHRRSGGDCTLGLLEPLDIAASVALANEVAPGIPIVTVGTSLGGVASLLHAGAFGRHQGIAGTVVVSTPAWWGSTDRAASERLDKMVGSAKGQWVLRWLLYTRVSCEIAVPIAEVVVGNIAPAFTIVVHDPDDTFFGPEHAETIYSWAGEPKALWWVPKGGHGTDILTVAFADRVLEEVARRLVASTTR